MKDTTEGNGMNYVLRSALPTLLIGTTANKPAREINERGSVGTIQTDITVQVTDSPQQTLGKVPAGITRSQTVHVDSEPESSATQQAENVASTGAEDAEALPMFQLPDDAFIEWPVDLDFGGALAVWVK